MTNANQILGTTADYNGCDCCGRENLKKYVVISHEDGTIGHYGTSCAAIMINVDTADVRKEANAADKAKAAAAEKARRATANAEIAEWEAWLAANGTGSCTIERVRSLGGMAAARKLYDEAA